MLSNNGKFCNKKRNTTIDNGGIKMMNNCIFCKIIKGEIPSSTIYEDDSFQVIMDISPATKGHAVLFPKKHAENLLELDDTEASKALIVAKKVAKAMKEELDCEGVNLLQNNGEIAGQTIFHFHIHIIPRYQDDQVKFLWTVGKYGEGEAASMAAAISNRIK